MRLGTPKTPGPYGLEPAYRADFLSADECAGMGISLLPALTPPTVNQGMVLNGTTQYAVARAGFLIPQQFTFYCEFLPTFNFDVNAVHTFICGDGTAQGWLFKNTNANLNRLYYFIGAGAIYVDGVTYGAIWRQNQRNKLCVCAASGAGVMYLNGVALASANVAWTIAASNNYFVGSSFAPGSYFAGTFYDVQIYTRLLTAAEAIQLTTVT